MPSVVYAKSLPSLGPPLCNWGTTQPGAGVNRNTRRDKLGLWSAVALQQHFAATGGRGGLPLPLSASESHSHEERGGTASRGDNPSSSSGDVFVDLRSHLGPAPSVTGRMHRPTLAQRMGLVPGPLPAPSAEDWRVIVHRALLREQQHSRDTRSPGANPSVCAICQMSHSISLDEGQVILSCSHVFHAQCFRSFERYVRAQQRADALGVAEVTAPLACPVCRTQNYYKRVFYEGKAVAQRAAIIKVQAAVRGLLARRAYTKLRLDSNPEFRTRYVQERLTRLSAAWETFCEEQQQRRVTLQTALAVHHQMARALHLSEEAWAELWRKAVYGTSTSVETEGSAALSTTGASLQCPICLERIRCTQCPGTGAAAFHVGGERRLVGEEVVAAMRMAYEARKADKRLPSVRSKLARETDGVLVGAAGKSAASRKTGKPLTATPGAAGSRGIGKIASRCAPRHRRERQKGVPQPAAAPSFSDHGIALAATLSSPKVEGVNAEEATVVLPHSGVLLSCGHYFHSACIDCYERFNDRHSLEMSEQDGRAAVIFPNRCPICRSGYAKHPM